MIIFGVLIAILVGLVIWDIKKNDDRIVKGILVVCGAILVTLAISVILTSENKNNAIAEEIGIENFHRKTIFSTESLTNPNHYKVYGVRYVEDGKIKTVNIGCNSDWGIISTKISNCAEVILEGG